MEHANVATLRSLWVIALATAALPVQAQTFTSTGAVCFTFSRGVHSLSGTATMLAAPVAGGPGFEISYTITSGTGVFAGRSGSGSSLVRLRDDINGPPPYDDLEAGILTLVPEPAGALPMLGGALGLAGWRRRRRGSASQ